MGLQSLQSWWVDPKTVLAFAARWNFIHRAKRRWTEGMAWVGFSSSRQMGARTYQTTWYSLHGTQCFGGCARSWAKVVCWFGVVGPGLWLCAEALGTGCSIRFDILFRTSAFRWHCWPCSPQQQFGTNFHRHRSVGKVWEHAWHGYVVSDDLQPQGCCCTWGPALWDFTLARWLNCQQEGFPQPLRTSTHPWGLPELSIRELVQCANGSILFLKVLALITLVHVFGGATTLEHPKGPEEGCHPGWAIWHSSFVKKLLLDPSMQLITFAQGPLGKRYMKPTKLLVGRMNFLAKELYSQYDLNWKPSQILGGKNSDGSWRTSEAKSYPDRLCRTLALGFIRHDASVELDGFESDPDNLQEALSEMAGILHPDMQQGQMKDDFQRHHFR